MVESSLLKVFKVFKGLLKVLLDWVLHNVIKTPFSMKGWIRGSGMFYDSVTAYLYISPSSVESSISSSIFRWKTWGREVTWLSYSRWPEELGLEFPNYRMLGDKGLQWFIVTSFMIHWFARPRQKMWKIFKTSSSQGSLFIE